MKKQIILVGAIAAMCLGIFLTSCKKFEGCTCRYYSGGSETATAAELEEAGFTSCSQLESSLDDAGYPADCTEL